MHKRGDTPVPGYTLTVFLGRGGYGEVWQASAPGGAPAALKFVSLTGLQGLKEYRAVERIKAIRHANLLPIHAFWVLDGDGRPLDEAALKQFSTTSGSKEAVADTMVAAGSRPALLVMAMPLGDKNLSQRLGECRSSGIAGIPPTELLDSLEDAARAIDYLNSPRHDLGEGPVAISHSDVKPQNIMLVGTSAQLCDFGLARVLGPSATTTTGGGTPAYIPPEILADRTPMATSDQYSLAVSYIELRTGRLPFGDSESYVEVLDAHLKGNLDLSALPEPEREVIKRAAARQPADRFPTCLEMIRALRAACPPDTIPSLPQGKGLQDTQDITGTATPSLTPAPSRPKTESKADPKEPAARPTWSGSGGAGARSKMIQAVAAVVVGLLIVFAARSFIPREPVGQSVAYVPDDPGQKKPPEKIEPKKADPEKVEPKKTDPEKVEPKKVEPKKIDPPIEPKKAEPPPLEKSWKNSVGMTLLLIPAGEFTMGSPAGEPNRGQREDPRSVQIARPFYLAAHEVTQAQFQEVMGKNPSHFSAQGAGRPRLGDADPAQLPVEKVSYTDAIAFCEQLSARAAEKESGRTYRLPTEAEWEYACRAGTKTAFGSGEALTPRFALCDFGPAGGVPQPKRPTTVGSLSANPWGLFDMHGNVAEWCRDWYADAPAGGADPQGPSKGTDRVLRGGGFYDPPAKCRSADRFHAPPETTDFSIGFRVLCETK